MFSIPTYLQAYKNIYIHRMIMITARQIYRERERERGEREGGRERGGERGGEKEKEGRESYLRTEAKNTKVKYSTHNIMERKLN